MKRISTILIGLCFLSSCDCYQRVAGIVIDKDTSEPLIGVVVYNKKREWRSTVTDSTGHFELSNISGGFRCPPMTIVVETTHYKKCETSIPAGGQEIVKLEKELILPFRDSTCVPRPDLLGNQEVYSSVDKKAEFPGGQSAFMNYLRVNFRYPNEIDDWKGTLHVTFIVDSDGRIRNQCIYVRNFTRDISTTENLVLDLIRDMPRWTPAEKDGQKVNYRVFLPFRL